MVSAPEDLCQVNLQFGQSIIKVKVHIKIPSSVKPIELAYRVIQHHMLPIHLHSG